MQDEVQTLLLFPCGFGSTMEQPRGNFISLCEQRMKEQSAEAEEEQSKKKQKTITTKK